MKLKKIIVILSLLLLIGNISLAETFDYQGVPNVVSASVQPSSNSNSSVFPYHIFVKVAIVVIALAIIYFFFRNKKGTKEDLENIEYEEEKENKNDK